MNFIRFLPELVDYFPALISGALMTLAFPAAQWSWLAWGALVPLALSLRNVVPSKAFKMGLAMGLVHFSSLIYWIVPTLCTYGNLSILLALPVFFLLVSYLALYPALFCLVIAGDFSHKKFLVSMPLKAAVVWVALEFIRAKLFTGFPWGLTGYSQYLYTNLIQIADITGVYGISFLIVVVNFVLAMGWHQLENRTVSSENKKSEAAFVIVWAIVLMLVIKGILLYGHERLTTVERRMANAPHRVVSVIQGNIPQAEKWDDAYKEKTVSTYCQLSRKAPLGQRRDLIIWPETALPFYYTWDEGISEQVNHCIRKINTWFLIGSPAFSLLGKNTFKFFNRAYMVTPQGTVTGTYDKIHLVPFGEYVPFGKYLTFLDKLTSQAGDFSPGTADAKPLAFRENHAGVLICFEIIFPKLVSNVVKNGADLLVTMTNDAWFGRSSAPLQHFSMAVFRAVENRRSVARAANTGISGFIDPMGRITGRTALFQKAALTQSVSCLNVMSFYTKYGDLFAWLCLLATAIFAMPWKHFSRWHGLLKPWNRSS